MQLFWEGKKVLGSSSSGSIRELGHPGRGAIFERYDDLIKIKLSTPLRGNISPISPEEDGDCRTGRRKGHWKERRKKGPWASGGG
jgi:hypothetical protein